MFSKTFRGQPSKTNADVLVVVVRVLVLVVVIIVVVLGVVLVVVEVVVLVVVAVVAVAIVEHETKSGYTKRRLVTSNEVWLQVTASNGFLYMQGETLCNY